MCPSYLHVPTAKLVVNILSVDSMIKDRILADDKVLRRLARLVFQKTSGACSQEELRAEFNQYERQLEKYLLLKDALLDETNALMHELTTLGNKIGQSYQTSITDRVFVNVIFS